MSNKNSIYMCFLATVVTFSVVYYFCFNLPAYNRDRIAFERQKYSEQKAVDVQNEANCALCTKEAKEKWRNYIKLNATKVGHDDDNGDIYKAPQDVWDSAEKDYKANLDICYRLQQTKILNQESTRTNSSLSNNHYYTNTYGHSVHSPAYTNDNSVSVGATAVCGDGTYSFSESRRGTCSHHGGVARWLR